MVKNLVIGDIHGMYDRYFSKSTGMYSALD